MTFPNLAGRPDIDDIVSAELAAAGIGIRDLGEWFKAHSGEVRTGIIGCCGPWTFRRAWYYWIATGPGLPPVYANALHETHGRQVRVDGHCGCPSPLEWHKGFAVGQYHVDTPDGLKALADTLKRCSSDAGAILIAAGVS
jgi:hypothetical protein